MATLTEIKHQFSISALQLNYQKDDKGERVIDEGTQKPTQWLRHWDNTNRVALVIHEDTVKKIQANPNMVNLSAKDNGTRVSKTGEKAEYHMFTIIAYTEADLTL